MAAVYLRRLHGWRFVLFNAVLGLSHIVVLDEIRVASDKYSFKSALKARDITVIQGKNPDDKSVNVFEGMTDFLSFLMMMNVTNLAGDSIIMHSLSSFGRAAQHIYTQDYKTIKTYLDNNKPGQECTERFCEEFDGLVVPQSEIFSPYTDLNDALRAHSKPVTVRSSGNRSQSSWIPRL